jgi:hypothetical protein
MYVSGQTDKSCVDGPVPTIGIKARMTQCILRQISAHHVRGRDCSEQLHIMYCERVSMVYIVEGATPNVLSFEGNVVPTDLKLAPIHMGVFFAVR